MPAARKTKEKKINMQEQIYKVAFNSFDAHVAIIDQSALIIEVNEPWLKFGRENGLTDPEGQVGKVNYLEVLQRAIQFGDKSVVEIFNGIRDVLAGMTESYRTEYPCNTPVKNLWFSMRVMRLSDGGAIIIHQDVTEQVLTREKLRLKEERLQVLSEAAGDMIYTITTDGIVTYANEQAAQTVGIPIEKLIGCSLKEIFPSQDLQALWVRMEKIINSNEPVHDGTNLPLPMGSIWLETWARPLKDAEGKVFAILGSSRDITERKRLEFALQESRDRLYKLFENHGVVMLLVEPNTGAIVDANIAAQNFYGYSFFQLKSMNIDQINILPTSEEMTQWHKRFGYENQNAIVFSHRLANGEVRIVEVHSSPIEVEGSTLLFSIIHDITERKQAEDQIRKLNEELEIRVQQRTNELTEANVSLQASEATLQSFYNSVPFMMGIAELDGDKTVAVSANRTMAFFLGQPFNDMSGQTGIELGTPEEFEQLLVENYKRCQQEGVPVRFEYEYPHASGSRWLDFTAAFIGTGPSGNPRFSFVVQDATKRKRAEEELLEMNQTLEQRIAERTAELTESEERYRSLIELVPFGIVIFNEDKIEYGNKTALDMFGATTLAEIYGRSIFDFVHPDYHPNIHGRISQAAQEPNPVPPAENVFLKLNGQAFPVESRGMTISLHGKRLFMCVILDITERKQAEKALQESNMLALAIINTVSDGIFLMETTGKLLVVNETVAVGLGKSIPELIGTNIFDTLPAELAVARRAHVEKAVRERKQIIIEDEHFGRWFDNRIYPITDSDGQIRRVLVYGRDITESKLAEEELHWMERRSRALIENAPDGIVLIGTDAKFKFASPSALRIFGYSEEDLLTGDPNQLTHPDDLPLVLTEIASLIQDPARVTTLSYRFLHKNGEWRWIESTFSNLLALPSVEAIVINFRDINERKLAEDILRESEEKFSKLFHANPVMLSIAEQTTGNFFEVNETWLRTLEFTREEVIGRSPSDINLFVESAQYKEAAAELSARGYLHEYETSIRSKHGRILKVVFSAEWIHLEGKPYLLTVASDITQIKQAEQQRQMVLEQLELERSLLRQLIDNLPDLIFLKDLESRFLVANQATADFMGAVSPENLLGRTDLDFYPKEQAEQFIATEKQVMRSGESILGFERFQMDADQKGHWLVATKMPLRNKQGQIIGLVGIERDVTARKQAENELRESEEKYRGLIESLNIAVILVDGDGRLLYINDMAAKLLGGTISDVTGKTFAELFPADVANFQFESIRNVIDNDRLSVFESARMLQGELHWFRSFAQPMHDLDGRVTRVLVSSVEISDLKIAQKELLDLNHTLEERVKERTAQLRDLYDSAPSGYHSLDANGNFTEVNQTELDWLGYTYEEVIGKPFTAFVARSSLAILLEKVKLLKEQGSITDLELEMKRKDDTVFTAVINSRAIYDSQGNYRSSRNTMLDITERKIAEDAMRLANLEMERALRVKDDFLAAMSHELRTPLTGILGISELLLGNITGELNERQRKYVQIIDSSGSHLLSLINDILDLSKIEAGKLEARFEKVMVNDLCVSSISFVKQTAAKKRVKLSLKFNMDGLSLLADPLRLKQILVNLLSNAVKFTPEGGTVALEVMADVETKKLTFAVIDTGIGIKPEDMSKLFIPFSQLDSSLARKYQGTGLGLSLVKKLTELHQGTVSVESKLGEGSKFIVTLPWWQSLEDSQSREVHSQMIVETPAPVLKRYDRKLILLAEDNISNANVIKDFLDFHGYDVVHAVHGGEVLPLMEERNPDLVLMDIQMPEVDGLEATRQIRSRPEFKDKPIIAITALAMPGDKERCFEAGANEYLAKPFNLNSLVEMVQQFLDQGT